MIRHDLGKFVGGLCLVLLAAPSAGAATEEPAGEPAAYAAFCVGVQTRLEGDRAAALKWFQTVLERDPRSATAHVQLGQLHETPPRDNEKAKKHFDAALLIDPDSFRASYGIARVLLRKHKYEEARDLIVKAADGPEAERLEDLVAGAFQDLAIRAQTLDKLDEAATFYEKAADGASRPAYPLLCLGRLYRRQGKTERAVETFQKVLRHAPYFAHTHRELCNTYKRMEKWGPALEQLLAYMNHPRGPGEQTRLLREASRLALRARKVNLARRLQEKLLAVLLERYTPKTAPARLCEDIANILAELGRHKEAVPYMERAVEAAEEELKPPLRLDLAELYEKLGRTEDAVRTLTEAIGAVEPKVSVRYRIKLSSILEAAEKHDRALEALKKILAVPGREPLGHSELARFYTRRGETEKAIGHLEEAIRLAKPARSARYRVHLSVVLSRADRAEEAEQVLIEAKRILPENPSVNNALGWFYAERGIKLVQALQLARKAIAVEPRNPYYLDTLGWVYYKQGKNEKALEQLLKADALASDGTINDHIGDVYKTLDRPNKARLYWLRALELDPDIQGIREKLDNIED